MFVDPYAELDSEDDAAQDDRNSPQKPMGAMQFEVCHQKDNELQM